MPPRPDELVAAVKGMKREALSAVLTACAARLLELDPPTIAPPVTDEMLTAEQAARRTGMSRRLLYRKARAGELPFAVHVSSRGVRFSARGIDRWLEQRRGD